MKVLEVPAVTGMPMPAQLPCLVFQESRGAGGEIRAFPSGDRSNQGSADIGIEPCLTASVQGFGSVTWPCLLSFSSSSSIKWNSRLCCR